MITLWHNPRCSKSRAARALLEARGASLTIRHYLDDPPSHAELSDVLRALDTAKVIDMARPGEALFRELGLSRTDTDQSLLSALAANPRLIERPIAIKGDRAVIGRPPENVLSLL